MGAVASQITSLMVVYSTVDSDADQRKHQSSASLAFVRGIHRGPVNFPHKWPVTRKMFPFDDVIMCCSSATVIIYIRTPGEQHINLNPVFETSINENRAVGSDILTLVANSEAQITFTKVQGSDPQGYFDVHSYTGVYDTDRLTKPLSPKWVCLGRYHLGLMRPYGVVDFMNIY